MQENGEESYRLKVIGYMRSPFLFKNGTPRQPGICHQVTGEITINKKIFNNPEHSLEGLEKFSHIWIFFIFHKNNNAHFKAKVKPPRLNGAKTGVFSTRSPYRPNNIGLTLAKIECVKGDTVTVSGIDILDGTPIIDLKPYIPQYDYPALQTTDLCQNQSELNEETEDQSACTDLSENQSKIEAGKSEQLGCENFVNLHMHEQNVELTDSDQNNDSGQVHIELGTKHDCMYADKSNISDKPKGDISAVAESDIVGQCESDIVEQYKSDIVGQCESDISDTFMHVCPSEGISPGSSSNLQSEENTQNCSMKQTDRFKLPESFVKNENKDSKHSSTADWISKSPVSQLTVRFTPSAEEQLKLFSAEVKDVAFKLLFLKSYTEAKEAIINILHEDPRSTYRRNHCPDSLYYFTLDVLHITCWFDKDLVEIVRIKPVGKVEKLKEKS